MNIQPVNQLTVLQTCKSQSISELALFIFDRRSTIRRVTRRRDAQNAQLAIPYCGIISIVELKIDNPQLVCAPNEILEDPSVFWKENSCFNKDANPLSSWL